MAAGTKRKHRADEPDAPAPKSAKSAALSLPSPPHSDTPTTKKAMVPAKLTTATAAAAAIAGEDMTPQLERIASSNRTPFEKRVWTLLCQVPRGQFTTYGLLAAALGQFSSSASSPRAVGNALRRNPFAPGVPCHRVVATGGALGGFKGRWPRDGEGITLDEKRALLRAEGVRFDAAGRRVLGSPFLAFV